VSFDVKSNREAPSSGMEIGGQDEVGDEGFADDIAVAVGLDGIAHFEGGEPAIRESHGLAAVGITEHLKDFVGEIDRDRDAGGETVSGEDPAHDGCGGFAGMPSEGIGIIGVTVDVDRPRSGGRMSVARRERYIRPLPPDRIEVVIDLGLDVLAVLG
jgi:hypothetical protein